MLHATRVKSNIMNFQRYFVRIGGQHHQSILRLFLNILLFVAGGTGFQFMIENVDVKKKNIGFFFAVWLIERNYMAMYRVSKHT